MSTKLKDDKNVFLLSLIIFFLLFIYLYFYKLGDYGLFNVDEPRYPEVAREMIESNNWIVPYFNYEVRYDKPVLFYWIEALSIKVFGLGEFSARFPSVLSSLICMSFLFYFVKTFYGYIVALITILILMSSIQFAALSRFSITDMTLNAFITSSIVCFFCGYNFLITSHRFFKLQMTEFSLWYVFAFIFLALAVLTKGPVAVVLIFLVLFPFFWWVGKLDYFFKHASFWLGLLLFFLMVLPWYIQIHFATEGEFTKAFFGLHNLSRYTSIVSGHKGSIFYYFLVLAIGFIPWIFFFLQSVFFVFKKGLKSLLIGPKEQISWFCFWWFLIVFLFFTVSKTKLLTYILLIFPPLSVLIGVWFYSILQRDITNKGYVIGLGVFFCISLLVLLCFLFNFPSSLFNEIKPLKLDLFFLLISFLLLIGVSMSWSYSLKNVSISISVLFITFLLVYFSVITFLLPRIDRHSQYLLRSFAKSVPKNVEVATYLVVKPSLTFYAKRHISKIDSIYLLQEKLNYKKKFAFVTKKKFLKGVMLDNAYMWGEDSSYVIFTNYSF